jgi:Notch-like protein
MTGNLHSYLWIAAVAFLMGCASEGEGELPDAGDVEGAEWVDGAEMDAAEQVPDGQPEGECLAYEECNGIDDDCDGQIDEDFDLDSDVNHCGWCNFACVTPNATPSCVNTECGVAACDEGFYDIDGDPYNGCEYACTRGSDSESDGDGTCADGIDNDCDGRADDEDLDCGDCPPEFCNSEDDDCDTLVDEDFDLRSDPVNCGQCGLVCPDRPNAEPLCVLGECYIQCEAGWSDADGDPLNGCEANCVPAADPSEYACDGIDADCDGLVDEDYSPFECGSGACSP